MFSFLKNKNVDPKANLLKVLKGYELPSFPAIAMEALQKLRAKDSSASSVAEVLALDPALSVKVLRMANSPAFSPRRPIENLTHGIALIGLSNVESIILSAGVCQAIPKTATRGYDSRRFWLAAARRGVLARELATILCPSRQSESFTAGFLQDLAVPFLALQKPEEYGNVLELWHRDGGSLAAAERNQFEWDHAEVATWICDEWNLPENIAAAIGDHHAANGVPVECPAPVALVALVDESEDNRGLELLREVAKKQYGLTEERLHAIFESGLERANALARLIV